MSSTKKNNMSLAAAIKTYITDSIAEIIADKKITKKIADLFENADFNTKLASTIASNIPKASAKPKRDENKPKKPTSTFLRFCKDNRAAVITTLTKKNKGEKPKNTDILKGMAAAWAEYKTAAESKPKGKEAKQVAAWEAEIAKEKLVYEDAMKSYVPPPGTSSGRKGGPAKTDPALPTRAPSAYLLFSKEHRAEILAANPGAKGKDVTSLLAKAWGELKERVEGGEDDDAKKEMKGYLSIVKEAKAEFVEKMKSYTPTDGYNEKGRLIKEGDDKKSPKKPAKKSKKDEESDDEPEEDTEEEEKPKSSTKKTAKKVEESDDEDDEDAEELEDE